jgi:hypothetical protein
VREGLARTIEWFVANHRKEPAKETT